MPSLITFPKPNSMNRPVVINTSDIHLNLTKGDKREQVEERGEGRWQHSKDDIMHPPTRTNGHGHLEGGEQKWGHLVPSVAFELMCYALGFQLKVEGGIKSPRLAPQSHSKK